MILVAIGLQFYMKKLVAFFALAFAVICADAQTKPEILSLTTANAVQIKNYPLLSMLMQDKAVSKILLKDTMLTGIYKRKSKSIAKAQSECKDVSCVISRLKFTDLEIAGIGKHLAANFERYNAFKLLVDKKLRPSGAYALYDSVAGPDLLLKAWEQDAKGVNYCIDVYGAGKAPNYRNIDSISYDVKRADYLPALLKQFKTLTRGIQAGYFFTPSMNATLSLLQFNGRDEAGDYEPMAEGINEAAYDRVRSINWSKYKHSLILVLGAGPDKPGDAISGSGKVRCRTGAQLYFAGEAPFIVVSGGRVHPFKTKFSEAFEMKKFLIDSLHVPAYAIIAEPHARHTTTNLRNTVRIMYNTQIPAEKPAMVCSDKPHIDYVIGAMMQRSAQELGYVPFKAGSRLSDTALEFYPVKTAMQVNPMEPLDP